MECALKVYSNDKTTDASSRPSRQVYDCKTWPGFPPKKNSQSKVTVQYQGSGGLQDAQNLFNRLRTGSIDPMNTTKGLVQTASGPGGTSASIRNFSAGGKPMVQIDNTGGPKNKIRF